MTSPATVDIAPKALQTPRAAGLAGVLFAVLFGVVVFLFHKVVPANPDAAGGGSEDRERGVRVMV